MIDIDGSDWKLRGDVYNAILPLIGAPGWHGANANALVESMVWGEINSIEPPYLVAKCAELARNWAPIPKPGKPIIEVDASRWTSYGDFYDGILP